MTRVRKALAPAATWRAVIAAVVVVLTSACSGIPSSGPVTKVADDSGLGQSTVRYAPARPSEGASPQQIVRGYLDAMLAYPASTGTASAFLTADAAKGWRSLAGVRVYSDPQVSSPTASAERGSRDQAERAGAVDVRLNLVEHARLDRQGRYSRGQGAADVSYRLEQVKGQWRIANPQVGLLVDRKFFTDYFRSFNIYFFDRPGRRLVPEPVYLTVGERLATALVTSLARGPLNSTGRTVRTYVPDLATLRPSVPVSRTGTADVEFDADFGALSSAAQDHLSAQVVWTLRQVPGITAVSLVGRSTALSTNGSSEQAIDSWGAFGPRIARGHAYAISRNRIVQVDGENGQPLKGLWGKNAKGAVAVAVDDDAVAAVLPGRSQLSLTTRKGNEERIIGGSGFIAPRWDDDGGLWLVDRPGSATRVRLVDGPTIRTLAAGSLTALDVRMFALSPDGSRYAVTVRRDSRAAMYVGSVLRGADDRILGLGDPSKVFTTARHPRSAVWSSGTELSFLAPSGSGVEVYAVHIDGSATTGGSSGGGASLPDVDARTLVIGTGETPPRYVTDARYRLWLLPFAGTWKRAGITGVTGLTYGR